MPDREAKRRIKILSLAKTKAFNPYGSVRRYGRSAKLDDRPEPPIPKEVDLRDFPKMPLKVSFLLNSDSWLLTTGDEAKAAITLWCRVWHQVPAGSLPQDQRLLARMSGNETKLAAHP